jgi:MFS family permease
MKKKGIILFCILTLMFWGGQYAYVPTLTPYAKSIGSSVQMIGLIGASYGLMQLIFRIPIGVFSDIQRKRKPYVIMGISFVTLSGICFLLIKTPAGALIARSLAGIASSFWAIFAVMFASYFTDQVRAIGILSACQSLGTVVATWAGGVISQRIGATAPFVFTTVLGLIGLALALMLKDDKTIVSGVKISDLYGIVKEKGVIFFSLLGMLLQFVSFGTAYVFTPLIAKNLGAGDTQLGILTFLFMLPSVFASLLIGSKLFKRIGFRTIFSVSFLLMAITSIPIAIIKSLNLLFVLQFIAGFGYGTCFTGLLSLIVSSIPNAKRATATAFYQAVYALGMFIGPVFTGFLSNAKSFLVPYAILGAISTLAAVATIVFFNRMYKGTYLSGVRSNLDNEG